MAVRSFRTIVTGLAAIEELVEHAIADAIDDNPRILQAANWRIRSLRIAFQADLRSMECEHDFRRQVPSGPRDNGESYDVCVHCRDIK